MAATPSITPELIAEVRGEIIRLEELSTYLHTESEKLQIALMSLNTIVDEYRRLGTAIYQTRHKLETKLGWAQGWLPLSYELDSKQENPELRNYSTPVRLDQLPIKKTQSKGIPVVQEEETI